MDIQNKDMTSTNNLLNKKIEIRIQNRKEEGEVGEELEENETRERKTKEHQQP